jgi:hypothetical protein
MARYLARACPRCNGYVGIIIREPGRNMPLQAVNGRCTDCPYRIVLAKRYSSAAPQTMEMLQSECSHPKFTSACLISQGRAELLSMHRRPSRRNSIGI